MLRQLVLAAVTVFALAAVPSVAVAGGNTGSPVPRVEVAKAIVAQVPGARLRTTESGEIDPLFNVPPPAELAAGRAQVMADPDFWVAAVRYLLQSGAIVPPTPIDWVKPEAFLPTAPVAEGGTPSALPRRERDLSKVTYEWHGEPKTLRQFMRTTETDIVAFIHNGRIVGDFYENGWDSETRHQPWSVTKTFVAATVGIAVSEGKARSVNDHIDEYIPELKGTAWEGARIVDVLQMRSGVFWDEDTPVLAQNTQVQQWIQAALDLVTEGKLGQGRNDFLKALPKETDPGTKWRYNSGATQVLAWLTERVYGKPFNEILSEKLWQPAGMEGDARMLTDRVGDAIASQGLYSRVFDLARFGELLRNAGRTPEGRQVVPAAWVHDMTTLLDAPKGAYGYQTWIGPMPGTFQASGFQGQKISVAPDHCLTGVRLSHAFGVDTRPDDGPAEQPESYGFGTEFHAKEWNAMYRAVAERLGGCDPRKAVQPPGVLRFVGSSRLSRARVLRRGALRIRIDGLARRTRVRLTATTRRGLRVAARQTKIAPGPARSISLRLTTAGRRWLRHHRMTRLILRARAARSDASRRVTVR